MAKRVHTAEFKREAVRLASKPGVSKGAGGAGPDAKRGRA
jgi:transposase-like protein